MNRKYKNAMIASAVATTVAATGALVYLGENFIGPFRFLHVDKVARKNPKKYYQNGVVFYGASNFRLWTDMKDDLAPYKVANSGIGEATDKDLVQYADKLLYNYNPNIVVFQTGSNNYIKAKGNVDEIVKSCMLYKQYMFTLFHEKLPDTKFVVLSGLLLPGRHDYLDITIKVNYQLQKFCEEHSDFMTYVDCDSLTYQDKTYRDSLFLKNGYHLNRAGQVEWANKYIKPVLDEIAQN